jgi:LAO/AO transport system kinase
MANSIEELVSGVHERNTRALARAISVMENGGPAAAELARAMGRPSTRAQVIGITGSPGVGKSTVTSALVSSWRSEGATVAVIAVDPSSPFSGGALLGDRIRMQEHAGDRDVYIRSMASRGHLGGLAAGIGSVLRVLDAAGFNVVILETVGVGQSEVEVAEAADSTVVVLAPGMGDAIQAAKAGILEVGDLFVVNKADREGAAATARELRHMISLAPDREGSWIPSVLLTVATENQGVDELRQALVEHHAYLLDRGELEQRRRERVREEILAVALAQVRKFWEGESSSLAHWVSEVDDAHATVWEAAESLNRGVISPE